jgi:threonine synthase
MPIEAKRPSEQQCRRCHRAEALLVAGRGRCRTAGSEATARLFVAPIGHGRAVASCVPEADKYRAVHGFRLSVQRPLDAGLATAKSPASFSPLAAQKEYNVDVNANLTAERPTFVTHLECSWTGQAQAPDKPYNLSEAGKPLLVRYDLPAVRAALTRQALTERPTDLWRWRELLPVRKVADIVSLGEVATPLIPLKRSVRALAATEVLVKDEGRLPTGSFKARGLAVAISMAKAFDIRHVAMPSNGNAGAALAAYAGRAGMRATVFCPEDTPEINLSEIALQGGSVYRVNGLIDDCGKLVAQGRSVAGWFDVSTLKEPYRIEGKKTMGLELAEQLGWELPDVIFYPTGGGTGLIGMWKAFSELEAIGFIGSKRPRMVAVQAAGCAPIVRAYETAQDNAPRWENARTIASGIRVPQAIGDFLILRAVRESGGFAIAVSDESIVAAVDDVARKDGLLLSPEGGATVAAYQQALANGQIRKEERVVLFNCATGLKYPMLRADDAIDRNKPIDFRSFA